MHVAKFKLITHVGGKGLHLTVRLNSLAHAANAWKNNKHIFICYLHFKWVSTIVKLWLEETAYRYGELVTNYTPNKCTIFSLLVL
jgi:hypothetical protein